jgi:hypothetical protein
MYSLIDCLPCAHQKHLYQPQTILVLSLSLTDPPKPTYRIVPVFYDYDYDSYPKRQTDLL